MTVKEIAHAFDMTVCELAEHIGYSRQALYSGEIGDSVRFRSAVKKLEMGSRLQLQLDHRAAVLRYDARTEAIRALMEIIEGGADNG